MIVGIAITIAFSGLAAYGLYQDVKNHRREKRERRDRVGRLP